MTCDLQTYVDAVHAALVAGTNLEAWRTTYSHAKLFVLNGEAPHRQGIDEPAIPAVVVLPLAWRGGQVADSTDRDVSVELRVQEAEGAVPASETGTGIISRTYTAHRQMNALINAVLADLTTGLDGQDAAWAVRADADFDNSQPPFVTVGMPTSFTSQNTMPNP